MSGGQGRKVAGTTVPNGGGKGPDEPRRMPRSITRRGRWMPPPPSIHEERAMPSRAARICDCGHRIASGTLCPCEERRSKERKARHDAKRPSSSERGYDGKWAKERAAYLAVHTRCVRCNAPSTVVDHIVPHRGDRQLFWSRSNWQPLCTPCHSRAKQAEERRQQPGGGLRLGVTVGDRRVINRANFSRFGDFQK